MATPDERAARIRGNLNTRADRLSGNNNARAERIRGNLTSRAQRQTKDLVEGLQALAVPERQPPRLARSEPRGAIPAARGYAERNLQPGTGEGGGVSPGLVEVPGTREYYDGVSRFYSNTYLIFVESQALKAITFKDPQEREVRHEFALPEDG